MRPLNSLFTRLLVVQLGLVLALGVVFGSLFYVERNITVASLYADLWAPRLKPIFQSTAALPQIDGVLFRDEKPPSIRRALSFAPRFIAFRQALMERGVLVKEIWIDQANSEQTLWLYVDTIGRAPVWVGLNSVLVEPQWPTRLLFAFSFLMVLLVAVSWIFSRRITQPLEQLHKRIQTQKPGSDFHSVALLTPLDQATPEVQAIDAAYSDLLQRIKRYEQERSVLLAGVSHDLRTPLGRIRLASELLPDQNDVTPRKVAIARYVNDADRLIESFLDLVRSGELRFEEHVDLAATARRVTAGFEKPEDQISVNAPDSLLVEHANQLLVERLIANLIDNAFKHGQPPVHVVIYREGAQIWIHVQDCGNGIPADLIETMQEAFTRGDVSRAKSGSGLGLAIVRQIAQRMNGQLIFERSANRHLVSVCLHCVDEPSDSQTPR